MSFLANIDNGRAYKASVTSEVDIEAFCAANNEFVITNIEIDPRKYYDFLDGQVILNEEKTKELLKNRIESLSKDLLSSTDKYMLIDNPYDFSENDLNDIIAYRKKLRKSKFELPKIPKILEEV